MYLSDYPNVRQVSGIVGRAELLCTIFTWLSVLLYSHAIYAKNSLRIWTAMFGFALCVTIAMLCKETGITAIVSDIKIAFLCFNHLCVSVEHLLYLSFRVFVQCMI